MLNQGFRVVVDDQFERLEDRHPPQGALVQIIPNDRFKLRHFNPAIVVGFARAGNKVDDGFGGNAAPPQTAQGGQAGIVPAAHHARFNQFTQLTLAHHRVRQIQARKFNLAAGESAQLFQKPLIERPVDDVLVGAE